jgi:SpoVK/Ycf46/Vps4 family AAA+-type ATPase
MISFFLYLIGKTLTAEAIADLLKRPLYTVTVGELGTEVEKLEENLKEILEVSCSWNAVVLIDEADIFLDKRNESDLKRYFCYCQFRKT